MANNLSKAARDALAEIDWAKVDAMTDEDIRRQIASNPDAAPDMAPDIDVRAIRQATGMTRAEFAAASKFSVRTLQDRTLQDRTLQDRTLQEWDRGAKRPTGPARTRLRAIKGDPDGLRKALSAA